MRKQFIPSDDMTIAEQQCPWACAIMRVEGGWMCYESNDDFVRDFNQIYP